MSSRDGAVMRMTGGRDGELVECDSVLDCDGGAISVRRIKITVKHQRWRIHTD